MSAKSAMYLTALMQCLLSKLLLIKTPQGSFPKRTYDKPIAALSFDELKVEVASAKTQLTSTDSRPVTLKTKQVAISSNFEDPLHLAWSITEPGSLDDMSA